jgi:mRNA-degrading endonuclease RelE of RelBE toxin-antitoxin system
VRIFLIRGGLAGAVGLLGVGMIMLASSANLMAGQARVAPSPAPKPPAAKPQAGKNAGGARPVQADQLEKLLNMSPEEREKTLSKLPPGQRQRVQNRLDNLDRMSPAQREQNLERARQLEKLPPERRQAVTKQIQTMNGLSIADQRQILHSPDFNQNFSPQEQEIVRDRFPRAASDVVRPIDKLVPARRQAVNQQMQRIRAMGFEQRRQFLHSPEFDQNFSPEEQEIIRNNFKTAAK